MLKKHWQVLEKQKNLTNFKNNKTRGKEKSKYDKKNFQVNFPKKI